MFFSLSFSWVFPLLLLLPPLFKFGRLAYPCTPSSPHVQSRSVSLCFKAFVRASSSNRFCDRKRADRTRQYRNLWVCPSWLVSVLCSVTTTQAYDQNPSSLLEIWMDAQVGLPAYLRTCVPTYLPCHVVPSCRAPGGPQHALPCHTHPTLVCRPLPRSPKQSRTYPRRADNVTWPSQ